MERPMTRLTLTYPIHGTSNNANDLELLYRWNVQWCKRKMGWKFLGWESNNEEPIWWSFTFSNDTKTKTSSKQNYVEWPQRETPLKRQKYKANKHSLQWSTKSLYFINKLNIWKIFLITDLKKTKISARDFVV